MFKRKPTDEDIERLLSGATPEDEALARLAPLTDALKRAGGRVPSEAEVDRVAVQAARIAGTAAESAPTSRRRVSSTRTARASRFNPRLATPLVVVLLLCSTTGVAFASDGAAPGDTLYSFDRAVEAIGIGAGGLHERLSEADVLAGRGQLEDGLAHAAEALADHSGTDPGTQAATQEACAARASAANAIATGASGDLDQVRARLTEMLRWMATTQETGSDLAKGVTTRVRAMSEGPGNVDTTSPGETPGGPSGTTASTHHGTTGTTDTTQQGSTATSQQGSTTGTTAGQPGTGPGTTIPTPVTQSTATSTTTPGSTSTSQTPSTQQGQPGTTGGGQNHGTGGH
jgi:hypothetical protein